MTKIFVSGHRGMVGSAIVSALGNDSKEWEVITRTRNELNLCDQKQVENFFKDEKPEYVINAAGRVGGIHANNTYPAEFIYENLMIQNNIIHNSFLSGVKKLLFLGSSCIYPKNANQPIAEEALLSGNLEQTNEPYAIAKIAGIKLCESYNRQYKKSHNIDYRSRPYDILFVGNLNYIQNIRMIQNLEKICSSGPHSWKILIAGSNPNRAVKKMIVRNNWDLIENFEDAKNIFMLSKILVCPSRDVSGVQTKILDAFAFCVPVVCYSEANYGVNASPETDIVTANTTQEFYEELKKLLDDDARLKALGVQGRKFLDTNYKLSENAANFWRKILQ